jgi:hypothetical protein
VGDLKLLWHPAGTDCSVAHPGEREITSRCPQRSGCLHPLLCPTLLLATRPSAAAVYMLIVMSSVMMTIVTMIAIMCSPCSCTTSSIELTCLPLCYLLCTYILSFVRLVSAPGQELGLHQPVHGEVPAASRKRQP